MTGPSPLSEQSPDQPTSPFIHQGPTGAMIRLALTNLALNIVTLSLWRFWGKTRVRRALWGNTLAWGDAAQYTGQGRELFLGFALVLVAILMPLLVANGVFQALLRSGQSWAALPLTGLQVLVLFLAAAGLYRARRYQMSRTLWRGIRGGMDGAAWRYGLLFLLASATSVLSLGWAWPWAEMTMMRYRLNHTQFGNRHFQCSARSAPLYGRFAVLWLAVALASAAVMLSPLLVATMGYWASSLARPRLFGFFGGAAALGLLMAALSYAWYRAAWYRELAAHTMFDQARFSMTATTGGLIRLTLGNMLISLLSLGILRPWSSLRTFRFACNHLRVTGEPVWTGITTQTSPQPRLGEGLAAAFDGVGDF